MEGGILFVDACVNKSASRTHRLAEAVLERLGGDAVRVDLEMAALAPFDSDRLARRARLAEAGRFDDPVFALSRQFAEAGTIVLASPYWGCMFNSLAKLYLEHVDVVGSIYRYDEVGDLVGMCRAESLYYVTTRGGREGDEDDLGYLVVKKLCSECGIGRCVCISASGLDIVGNDPEALLAESMAGIDGKISGSRDR